ncbi:hypothetical protein IN01_22860 [Salmonella enterica subsp. enterica]|nr:hypothetical protein DMP75_27220 [Klebsiella michiganensis]EAA3622693.1 hypothetical protein [Salmonella enterica subsp. enterica]EBS9771031.1 hypothetical protein [Salmonella enterica]ECB3179331.1 hypothetical protein [Salmonella enterica subsp. enterica serovar Kentucky]ECV9229121.1 hypothetical protein [Salmonella enterica subsp. enterica serovar Infantis]MCQ4061228.1 hypothetical protein [Klebsiella pneumoniae]
MFLGYNVNVFIFVHIDADDDFQVPDWHGGRADPVSGRVNCVAVCFWLVINKLRIWQIRLCPDQGKLQPIHSLPDLTILSALCYQDYIGHHHLLIVRCCCS